MAELLEQLQEALTGVSGRGEKFQAGFRVLPPEDQHRAVWTRLLKLLSGESMPAWTAKSELEGLNFNLEGRSLYVSNFRTAVGLLGVAMSVAKKDVDLPQLEDSMGVTSPEDEAAFRYLKIPFEWQQEAGGEIIKTEVGLWDAISEWLDVENMRTFSRFVDGDEQVIKQVLEEYFPDSYLNDSSKRAEEIDKLAKQLITGSYTEDEEIDGINYRVAYTRDGDKIISRDLAFDAIVMRKILRRTLGLKDEEKFPGLPYWTSLVTPKDFPVEDLSHRPDITNPQGTELSFLWDALGPFVTSAEGLTGVTGDYQNLRQDISPWLAMQSQRSRMTHETYEEDTYNTTSYLAADAIDLSVIYDALLHRAAADGVKEQAIRAKLKNAETGAECRLNEEEVKLLNEIVTIELPFDPRALHHMVSQKKIGDFDNFWSRVRKMQPREPGGSVERRARPVGTWWRVARAYVDANPKLFQPRNQGGKGLYDRKDFSPWMEQAGIRSRLLEEIKSKREAVGGCIGKEGLVTLLQYAGMRIANIPYGVRVFRNWFHYAKSVDETINGNIKPSMDMLFQSVVSAAGIQRMVEYKQLNAGLGYDATRARELALLIEKDTDILVGTAMAKMSDPQNAPAFRFREGPEMTAFIIQQLLLMTTSAHLVYPINNEEWMHTPEMAKLRESIPSAGYLVEVDWDDFVQSGGQQMRPARVTRRNLEKIANNLGESFSQREKALLDRGYYWMPWKSKVKERDGQKIEVPEDVLHHPMRKPVRKLVKVQGFLDGLSQAVDQLEENAKLQAKKTGRITPQEITNRIAGFRSLLDQPTFSPVHLQGIYAYPGEALRIHLNVFESTKSGTPFLQGGSLDGIRAVIDDYENAGILPRKFTTVRGADLEGNQIDLRALEKARKEIIRQLDLMGPGLHLSRPSNTMQLTPRHLRVTKLNS